ncbi:MAG: carboxypeptidase-like regulatory domain-containing protein [Cyanobacteriota bacterium]
MKKISLLLFLSAFIFSCEDPIPKPTSITTGLTVSSSKLNEASIKVIDGLSKKIITNSNVKLIYKGKDELKKTDEEGNAKFSIANDINTYSIEVSADGYLNTLLTSENLKQNIISEKPLIITVNLFKVAGVVSGRVLSSTGEGIDSALINLNNMSTTSDSDGNFKINVYEISPSMFLSISKTGFKPKDFANFDISNNLKVNAGDLKLEKLKEKNFFIETGKLPFGNNTTDNANLLGNFSKIVQDNNFTVFSGNFLTLDNNNDIDTLFIPSPYLDYLDEDIKKIVSYVKSGKKLIVSGEWGGYTGFSNNSINKILAYANLNINTDIVKEKNKSYMLSSNPDYIIPNKFIDHFINKNITSVAFYGSSSVNVKSGGITPIDTNITKEIMTTSNDSFRIQSFNKGPVSVVAVSNIGNGKVIVLGDTSILTDSFSSGTKSNILSLDNKKFVNNIINW